MRQLKKAALLQTITLMVILFASYNGALAQDVETVRTVSSTDQLTLRGLLEEVRLLRLTVQQVNMQTYRTQVTLGRIRIQQERVDRLTRQLESARNELVDLTHGREQLVERIKDLEEKIKSETDEEDRARNQNVLKDLQIEQRQQTEKEQARRERENQIAAQLQSEQAALDELNIRLEKLERDVESTIRTVERKR